MAVANPFVYINAINNNHDIVDSEGSLEGYVPFVINRTLSYFPDTALLANEMNKHHHIDSTSQFYFFINTVRKRKRFTKWHKRQQPHDDIEAIKRYYGFNERRAREAVKLLSEQQLQIIREKTQHGGRE